jgi:apolipoprotein N-acyltransferase
VWLGLLTGAVAFGGTLYWVVNTMATYGDLAWPVAALVGALMVAYLSIFPALFALLVSRSVRAFGVAGVWLAPCLWVATEWARATLGFAFPWAMLGTSQARVLPVVQLASVTGVYGLSWLVALVGAASAAVVLSRRRAHLWGAAAVGGALALVTAGGVARVASGALLTTGTVFRVGLVQGDIEQDAKWNKALRDPIMERHLALSRQALGLDAGLVIWPESSTPFYFDLEPDRAEPVRRLAVQSHTPFLIGTDEFEHTAGGDRYYNSAVLVGPDGRSRASYRKMQLVPFGEYVPLKRLLFFVGPLVQAVSDFSPGTDPLVFDVNGHGVSVAICYESVYPWIARAFVQRGSELLATVTNDAWFGRSSAAYQHFDQGAVRAVEEGRYVVRAANTGISGAVDPYGRVVAATRLFEPTAIAVDVRLLSARTIYNRIGDVVVWISLVVSGLVLVAPMLRRRR